MAPLVTSVLEIEPPDHDDSESADNDGVFTDNPPALSIWKSSSNRLIVTSVLTVTVVLPILVGIIYAGSMTMTDGVFSSKEPENESVFVPSCAETESGETFEELMELYWDDANFTSCLPIIENDCRCFNPTTPRILQMEQLVKPWNKAFEKTKADAEDAAQKFGAEGVDVVMLGDSITEHWLGTDFGQPSPTYQPNAKVFQDYFNMDNGAQVDGVVLGIAAERCSNLLFRLRNNGLGTLQTKIVWLLIGTNDLGTDHCSVDAVVAGNIAIVEELRMQRPNATIVINSILPSRGKDLHAPTHEINERLQCYASLTRSVEFFDATSIFQNTTSGEVKHMVDGLHPDGKGSKIWGRKIVKRILEIDNRNNNNNNNNNAGDGRSLLDNS